MWSQGTLESHRHLVLSPSPPDLSQQTSLWYVLEAKIQGKEQANPQPHRLLALWGRYGQRRAPEPWGTGQARLGAWTPKRIHVGPLCADPLPVAVWSSPMLITCRMFTTLLKILSSLPWILRMVLYWPPTVMLFSCDFYFSSREETLLLTSASSEKDQEYLFCFMNKCGKEVIFLEF